MYIAVGTPTGGPSVDVLNNITQRALWCYGRRRSHPGFLVLPSWILWPGRSSDQRARPVLSAWHLLLAEQLRRAYQTGREACGIDDMMGRAVPSPPFNAMDSRARGACGFTVCLGNSWPVVRSFELTSATGERQCCLTKAAPSAAVPGHASTTCI